MPMTIRTGFSGKKIKEKRATEKQLKAVMAKITKQIRADLSDYARELMRHDDNHMNITDDTRIGKLILQLKEADETLGRQGFRLVSEMIQKECMWKVCELGL